MGGQEEEEAWEGQQPWQLPVTPSRQKRRRCSCKTSTIANRQEAPPFMCPDRSSKGPMLSFQLKRLTRWSPSM